MERTLTRRPPRSREPQLEIEGPGLAAMVVLTTTVATGLICVAIGILRLLLPATVLPEPFPPQNQDAETLVFLIAFAVVLPLSLYGTPRIADRIAGAGNGPALPALAALVAASLATVLIAVRLIDSADLLGGFECLLALTGSWLLAVGLLLRRAAAKHWPALLALRSAGPWPAAVTGVLSLAALLAFTDLGAISPLPLIVVLALGAAAIRYWERIASMRLRRPWGSAVDAGVVILLALAIPNVVVFSGEPFETTILQFHQNFFLGPANQVLQGGAMLVDTFSQYGVGSILFLAGVFQLVPAGNGTVALIEAVLSVAMFVSAYLVLRIARVSRPLAATALAMSVLALAFALVYPLGGLLQHGAIRFGMPVLFIFAAVAAARWPERTRGLRAVELAVIGLSSIWALEAFAYTLLTFASILALEVSILKPGLRRSHLAGRLAGALAACVAAHAIFAVTTLIAVGQLPDWGRYAETLRAFLTGGVGDLTYDFEPWSPALPVAALYLASAAAVVLTVRRRPDLARLHRIELFALTGATAWGIALFSYFVNRSAGHILPYICLPAVMAGALWLSLLLRSSPPVSGRIRDAAMVATTVVAALVVSIAWSAAGRGFSDSALAHAAPGGDSLRGAVERLWEGPVLKPGAPEGGRLLEAELPAEDRSLVIADADLTTEVLTETGRASELPLGDPWEDSFVPEQHLDALGDSIGALEPGRLMLVDEPALSTFRTYLREPDRDPLESPVGEEGLVPTGIAKLQEWALREIGLRFRLRTVAVGEEGLSVVELVSLAEPGAG